MKVQRQRRVTWRTVVFLLLIVLVFAAALFATDWYYKNTYSVGVSDEQVVIFRGPPDTDILWFKTEILPTDVAVDDLRDAEQRLVEQGVGDLSLAEANRYVERLEAQAAAATTTTVKGATATTVKGATTTTVKGATATLKSPTGATTTTAKSTGA